MTPLIVLDLVHRVDFKLHGELPNRNEALITYHGVKNL